MEHAVRQAAGPPADGLDPGELVASARASAGDGDGRPLKFLPALHRLVEAADTEAGLTAAGRGLLRYALVAQLVTQIQADRLMEAHPEIGQMPIEAPVVITGMPRTGTTALHNLLAEVPGLRAPRLWELLAPAAPAGPGERDQLIDAARLYVDYYYAISPDFQILHPVDALGPDECHRLTGTTFSSEIYVQRYRVPGYRDWLRDQDFVAVYQQHRALLSCLLWRSPGGRVLLKCPTHLWHLDALAAVYPGALVVRLHRDPMACIPSACSLSATIRATAATGVDKAEIGRDWLDGAAEILGPQRRGESPVPGIRVLDVYQRDLLADPRSVVSAVCEAAGTPLTSGARGHLDHYIRDNPPGKNGVHHYSLADFGIKQTEIEQRFAGYRAEFGL
jgi:hypothetical protein